VNVLAEAARLSAAEVPDITDALLQFGVAANSAKIPIEQSSALIEVMAEKGVKGADAGTKLRNVLVALNAPEVLDQKALTYFEKHGVNLQTLSDKSLSFGERLKELGKISGDAAAYVSIFGKENSIAAQIITENVGRVNELTTALSKDGLSTAYDQAATNTQTLGNATAKLGATWDTIMTKQGAIGGFLTWLVNKLTKALVTLDNLSSTWDLWVSNLTGRDMKSSTAQYIIDFGTLGDGKKKVADYFKEFDKMTNPEFMKTAVSNKEKFIKAMSMEGVELKNATILWDTYSKKRTDSMIESHKNGQNPGVNIGATPAANNTGLPTPEKTKAHGKKVLAEVKAHVDEKLKVMRTYQEQYEKDFTKQMYDEIDAQRALHELEASMDDAALTNKEANANKEIELQKQKNQKLVSSVQNYASVASGVMNGYFAYLQAEENANNMKADKKDQDDRKKLQDQLNKKLITQAQYDSKLAALDKEKEARDKATQQAQANRQKEAALFDATIKTLVAWLEAWIDPTKLAGAIGASAELAIIAATPVPQFYDGGYTGDGNGTGLDGRGGFKAILHPNEYVLNAQAMQNPVVQKVTNAIDAGVSPSVATATNATGNNGSNGNDNVNAQILEVLRNMQEKGVYGVWDYQNHEIGLNRYNDAANRRRL
jgi:hypothetical protein